MRIVRLAAAAVVLTTAAMGMPLASAQPDPTARVGVTVADATLQGYRFEQLQISSADGQRHYRVHLAVPRAAPPAQGFPVAYLLDGNAALMELDAELLQDLAARPHPPVLALMAHDNDLRIDGAARTFDYTPRRLPGQAQEFDVMNAQRRSGGADAFLDVIENQVKPAVAGKVAVDPARQMLWGHSYGGVFVLHALATRPSVFSNYVAVDPSLWWAEGFIVDELAKQAGQLAKPATLLLIQGGPADGKPAERRGPHAARGAGNVQAAAQLDAALHAIGGLQVERQRLPGLSHGQTLGAAIAPALRSLAD